MDMTAYGVFVVAGVVVIVVLVFIVIIIRRPDIPRIQSPTLGLYNLSSKDFAEILDADRKSIGHLFSSIIESTNIPPTCNVLFLYCQIEPDGSIRGSKRRLREIIRDTGAPIVVVASENLGENYRAASQKTGYGNANLVFTLERYGDVFPKFFQQLFTEMKRGTSMPIAWNKLAPQIPGSEHADCPSTYGILEVGQVAFK